MEQYTGACIYCGQVKMITAGDGLTQQEVNQIATMQCNCEEAQYLQKVEQKKTYAEANIKQLFAEDCQRLTELLMGTVDMLAHQQIRKVNVTTADGIKATLTAKEASIKVERTEIKKSSLED